MFVLSFFLLVGLEAAEARGVDDAMPVAMALLSLSP